MKKERIRWLVVLGTISMVGIALAQVYWISRALRLEEKELDQTIHVALLSAAEGMARFSNFDLPRANPVEQLASNYFVVDINTTIDANLLEFYLNEAFASRNLDLDYEYGIYDCDSDNMVYGNYVGSANKEMSSGKLPKWEDNIYYFGVRFPQRSSYLFGQLKIWVISTIILLGVIVFFAYALVVILKQKRLSEVQKDFVDNMTHEFKTPLSTMAISTNVLATAPEVMQSDRLKRYVGILNEEISQLKSQVDVLLQMTDVEKDYIELKKEPLHVNELLKRIEETMDVRMKQEGGTFSVNLCGEDCTILGDKMHLTNMIYGLLDNAIKYSPDNVEVLLSAKIKKGKLLLEVTDKGQGIPNEHQQKIFEKFYRVPTGNVHDVKGFGLGLSYIAKLAKAHGWKLSLTSAVDQGSTFTLVMPHE